MGKNQAYKAMQRSRVGSTSAQPEEVEDGMECLRWHAARLASLNTTHTITWEDYKNKQKDSSKKKKSKKRKHYASSESSSSSDEDESRRSRSSSKRSTKEKKHKSSRDKRSNKSKHETDGPVPLSRFFGNLKS
ncbi:hypothetical protein BRARA_I04113 [Brassica rapa]|uniref:Uncharacterized protein n=1 Tax=Brassica campestris TaxID=3711 RepID=A0A397YA34_BRACM|nr:hypothetical protein BRARA_I04113 [Brassica rapa]